MLNKREIKKNFSQSAAEYEKHAVLQKKMAQRLLTSLGGAKPKKILDLGCGTGYLAYQLARKYPQAVVTGIDLAPGMIKVAQKRYRRKNLFFRVGDGEKFSGRGYDLIVSNASLQWMELKKVLRCAGRSLQPGGWWIFSTFGPKTLIELRSSGFRVNKFLSLLTITRALQPDFFIKSGGAKLKKQKFKGVKEAICHLKELGAQNISGRKNFDVVRSLRRLRQKYLTVDGLPISFEVISLKAKRR